MNCFNLLQPFAGIHGKYFKKADLLKKYNLLKNTPNILNVSDALKNSTDLSYVDGVHYSPDANNKIALKIYDIILDKIN